MAAVLACIRCPRRYALTETRYLCECRGLLQVDLEPANVGRDSFESHASGVWRFRRLLPPIPDQHVFSRGEGRTNLYSDPRLDRWTGCSLRLKHEGENPTGSFKDRGMTVAVSHARWTGARFVGCASTGNTSASVASYAAAAGLVALTFVPEGKLAMGKLSQTLGYGARTIQIRGDFDAAMKLLLEVAAVRGLYLMNSLNPFRLEGQKTIVFELLQQLDWNPPDWIALPGGNLGNTSAFGKALRELKDRGLIDRVPRLAVIQAAGANPFYAAFRDGFRKLVPVQAETFATAIRIGNPVNYDKARGAIEFTRGLVEQVADTEIAEAKKQVDGAGIGCEPAAAASVAGVRKLVASGQIDEAARVVVILTGHILKDPDSILKSAPPPVTIDPDPRAVEKLLA
jgi:threonine synthase